MKISKSIKIKLFREMLRIRLIEQTIASKYHEAEMRCPVHLSVGQEAIAVGVCQNLKKNDKIVTAHRSHARARRRPEAVNAHCWRRNADRRRCRRPHAFEERGMACRVAEAQGATI